MTEQELQEKNRVEGNQDAEKMDADSYIEALNKMKENSVSKDDYLKLKAENRKLLNSLANGDYSQQEKQTQVELPKRIDCYKKYKENKFSNDIDYWQNFLDLRDATIREYGKDPLVTGNYGVTPTGEIIEPEYGEAEAMDNMCNTIKDIIAEANGDNAQFELLMKAAIK